MKGSFAALERPATLALSSDSSSQQPGRRCVWMGFRVYGPGRRCVWGSRSDDLCSSYIMSPMR